MKSIPLSDDQQFSRQVECVPISERSTHSGFKEIPIFQRHSITEEMFSSMWAAGIPLVIQRVMSIMSPVEFLENEENKQRMISIARYADGNELELQNITLENYFKLWESPSGNRNSWQIRVGPGSLRSRRLPRKFILILYFSGLSSRRRSRKCTPSCLRKLRKRCGWPFPSMDGPKWTPQFAYMPSTKQSEA